MRVVHGYSRDVWLFSVKREFRKLFFVTRDLKVLRDPWRTGIINRYSRFYHSILRNVETQFLRMVRVIYAEWRRYAISKYLKKLNSERLTVRLGWTVIYFPIFLLQGMFTTEKRRYNLNNQDKSLYICNKIAADTLMTFGGKVLSEEIEDTELLFKLNSVLNPPDATTINRRRQIFRFFLAVAACEHCLTIKYFRW